MNNKYLIIIILIIFSLILLVFWFLEDSLTTDDLGLNNNSTKQVNSEQADNNSNDELDKNNITDYLGFESLTIPYLREKSYDTPIFEIDDEIAAENNYTEYIASYRSDGLKINGLLTIPNSEMPENGFPVIIFLHGYIPPKEYKTTEKYVDYVDYLARNGFIVYKIDYRGHSDSEGFPSGAYYSSDYVVDTINAINAISTYDKADPEKIGLWGHSMSGNILLRTMAVKPEIKAGVIFAGAVYTYKDFGDYGISDSSFQKNERIPSQILERSQNLFSKIGEFTENSEFWKEIAPASYLNDFKGAVQIHHAQNDNVVSIEYTRNLKKLMDEAGVKNEVYEYSSGGHNLTSPAFSQAMQRSVDFYNNQFNEN